jgi:hypothetical protein
VAPLICQYSLLTILPVGARPIRRRSVSRVGRCAVARDVEAAGGSTLDGDLGRLKTGAPGGWPSPCGGARRCDGGRQRDGRRPGWRWAAARRGPKGAKASCQSRRDQDPAGACSRPPGAPCVLLRPPRRGTSRGITRRAARDFKGVQKLLANKDGERMVRSASQTRTRTRAAAAATGRGPLDPGFRIYLCEKATVLHIPCHIRFTCDDAAVFSIFTTYSPGGRLRSRKSVAR